MKRTLIMTETLGAAAEALQNGPGRTDEFLAGAKWVLEREAERGIRVRQDPPIYMLAMEGGARQGSLSLFYTIARDRVLLLSLSEGNAPPCAPGIGPGGLGY
jgi:hypothetical protein